MLIFKKGTMLFKVEEKMMTEEDIENIEDIFNKNEFIDEEIMKKYSIAIEYI